MGTKGRRFLLAAGVLGSIVLGAAPVLAQSHGGGHSGGGGGGHASGGGHFGGGGHAAAAGHVGGYAGGGHYAAGAHYAPSAHYAGGSHSYASGFHGAGYAGHGAYGRPGAYYGHGYSTGAHWRGGYWHGGFWPRAYYGWGFSWFLPVLPLAYATYWYSGVPYYYANDVYYTYNPSYEGYVATDPPPVADSSGAGPEGAGPSAAPPPGDAIAGQIFMYPKNGQSAEQQARDKAECQQWASQQAGDVAQNGSDYQRAMTACVEGRGYSAR
jgi:hypothetical protein